MVEGEEGKEEDEEQVGKHEGVGDAGEMEETGRSEGVLEES